MVRYGGTRVGGGGQRQPKSGSELHAVGVRNSPQAQQHPGRRLRRLRARAGRTFVGIRGKHRLAHGTAGFINLLGQSAALAGQTPGQLLKALRQLQGLRLGPQRKTPERQALLRIVQLDCTHASMIKQAQRLACRQCPLAPGVSPRVAGQQTALCHDQQTRAKVQISVQVNRQSSPHVFVGGEHGPQTGPERAIQDTEGVLKMVMLHFGWYFLRPRRRSVPNVALTRILPDGGQPGAQRTHGLEWR